MAVRLVRLQDTLGNVRDSVGSTGDGLLAGPTLPDSNRVSLDRSLAAEGAVFEPSSIL